MAYAPNSQLKHYGGEGVVGCFREKEYDHLFEYSNAKNSIYPEYNMMVWVGPNEETRFAKILKTVAYVIVDEDENGNPVVEKWQIKQHREY